MKLTVVTAKQSPSMALELKLRSDEHKRSSRIVIEKIMKLQNIAFTTLAGIRRKLLIREVG